MQSRNTHNMREKDKNRNRDILSYIRERGAFEIGNYIVSKAELSLWSCRLPLGSWEGGTKARHMPR